MSTDDRTTFEHLPREERQAISDLFKQAADIMAQHHARPGRAVRALTDRLQKHGMGELADTVWTAALTTGKSSEERVAALRDTLGTLDPELFQQHRQRKFAEVKTAERGGDVRRDIARNRFFSHYTLLTEDDIGTLAADMATWLRTLTPHERGQLAEFLRTSQGKYLPAPAHDALPGDTAYSPVTKTLLRALLVRTDEGVEVNRDLSGAIRDGLALCQPHGPTHDGRG